MVITLREQETKVLDFPVGDIEAQLEESAETIRAWAKEEARRKWDIGRELDHVFKWVGEEGRSGGWSFSRFVNEILKWSYSTAWRYRRFYLQHMSIEPEMDHSPAKFWGNAARDNKKRIQKSDGMAKLENYLQKASTKLQKTIREYQAAQGGCLPPEVVQILVGLAETLPSIVEANKVHQGSCPRCITADPDGRFT